MRHHNNQIGFLKAIFPHTKVHFHQEPARNATSIGAGKSDDKVTILNTYSSANQPTWYYVQHHQSGLKGWVQANKLFILNEPDSETLEKSHNTAKKTTSHSSFQASQSLVFSLQLMPKYFSA